MTFCCQRRKLSSYNFSEIGVENVWGVKDETSENFSRSLAEGKEKVDMSKESFVYHVSK